MHVPREGAGITGVSLFVIPTFHASSSATLEVAVAPSRMRYGHGYGDGASGTTLQGDAHHLEEEASLQVNGDPRNASDVESKGTVNGWSISDAQSTEGSVLWEACRYYEVGDVREGVQQVISNATLVDGLTEVEVYLRHHSGQNAFIEGNNGTYVNNLVLQIRSDCSWNQTGGSTSFASDSSSTPASVAHSYSTYNVYSAVNQRDSTGISGATNANSFNGFIQNGQRHPLCGGEYLNNCDLGPYGVGDVGDGSCQQHLNTEGCHYDGGK
ncbi:unnamed protein product [Pylaiella littoralis]